MEKGGSRSLASGPAAIAALLPLQSQGVVTGQGQRFSSVPFKRVNDGPLPPGPGLAVACLEGTQLICFSFFISRQGERYGFEYDLRRWIQHCEVCEHRVVQFWSVVSTSISLWGRPDLQLPSLPLRYHDKPAGRIWSLFRSNHQNPEVFRSDFSLANETRDKRGEREECEREKVHISLTSPVHQNRRSQNGG